MKNYDKVKQKINKITGYFALLLLTTIAFGYASTASADNTCNAKINFDANPKALPINQEQVTLTGWVDLSGTTPNSNGYCLLNVGFGGSNSIDLNQTNFQVTFGSSSNSPQPITLSLSQALQGPVNFSANIDLSNKGLTIGQTINYTAAVYIPSTSRGGSSGTLTTSSVVPVTVSSSQATKPSSAVLGDPCSTQDSSDCAVGYFCDYSNTKTCEPAVVGTNCMPDPTICASPLTCVNGACANSGSVTQMYGCPAATTGVYTCAATQTDPGIAACTHPVPAVTPPDMCGCTQANYSAGTCKNGQTVTPGSGTTATNGNTAQTTFLFNPLPESDLTHTFLIVIQGFLGILGILAVLFIIVGGFQMVIAAGNEEMILKGKKTITWAVLGLLAALLSFSIIAITQSLLQATTTPQTNSAPPNNTPAPQSAPPNNTPPASSAPGN